MMRESHQAIEAQNKWYAEYQAKFKIAASGEFSDSPFPPANSAAGIPPAKSSSPEVRGPSGGRKHDDVVSLTSSIRDLSMAPSTRAGSTAPVPIPSRNKRKTADDPEEHPSKKKHRPHEKNVEERPAAPAPRPKEAGKPNAEAGPPSATAKAPPPPKTKAAAKPKGDKNRADPMIKKGAFWSPRCKHCMLTGKLCHVKVGQNRKKSACYECAALKEFCERTQESIIVYSPPDLSSGKGMFFLFHESVIANRYVRHEAIPAIAASCCRGQASWAFPRSPLPFSQLHGLHWLFHPFSSSSSGKVWNPAKRAQTEFAATCPGQIRQTRPTS